MKKKSFLVAMLLVLSTTTFAYAEETTTDAGYCEFTGNEMKSSFDSKQVAVSVSEMEPGDAVNFQVKIASTADFDTNWYMSNTVLSSLEESQAVAENGGYTYTLIYTSSNGDVTVLYDSDSVGGEKESTAGVGLNEATDSLDEFFYLTSLKEGESGVVDLRVSLDGESQGNIYQDTLAALMMNFAVEKDTDDPTTTFKTNTSPHRVKTGDVWLAGSVIGLLAGIVLIVIAIVKRRKEDKDEKKS